MRYSALARTSLGSLVLLAAATSAAAAASPNYSLLTTIAIPTAGPTINPNAGGAFTAFDISFFDPTTQLDYVADRSNAGVDIFSGQTLSYVGRAPGFTGQKSTNSASGADGVLVVDSGSSKTLFAGDGNSTLKSFNVSTPSAPVLLNSVSTNGSFRVDEMAYSPTTNQVLAANNADSPAFGTLFNATTSAITHSGIVIPGAAPADGLEQPVWDPNTNSFYISVPQFGGTGVGGVAQINTNGTVGQLYKFDMMAGFSGSACAPTGLALGASGNLLVGCGTAGTQTVLLNPTANGGAGSIVSTLPQISGSDEVYYDPTTGNFFVTGVDASGNRIFDVVSDSSDAILQSISLVNANEHSISVDPVTGDVFVPLSGNTSTITDPLCPGGCIAVFAQNVPEPGTLMLLGVPLVALAGFGVRRLSPWSRPR